MGYNHETGHCDEYCNNCTYRKCIEHPQYRKYKEHHLKNNVVCKICGESFGQEYYKQTTCSEDCRINLEEQREEKISALAWIKHRGYKNKNDFIKYWGEEVWKEIQ
ncbi:MAG: hypothetical protein IKO36_00985 [Bacteroidaceae bacterium]|nr:hypothetical protein [Bacteroidaceae bacterium]